MNIRLPVVLAVLAFALSGCFTSETPLITGATASYPYESLVLRGDDGVEITVARNGDYYEYGTDPDKVRLMLQDFGDGLYLMQMAGQGEEGESQSLYAVLLIDEDAMTISLYRTIIREEDYDAGIPHCVENGEEFPLGCLTDGQTLIDLVKVSIAADEPPEGTFTIVTIN